MPLNDCAECLPTLPALRSLGDLAELRPTVIVGTREQTPLPISRLPVTTGTLATGDYSFAGGEALFSVERKTIADLVSCCTGRTRERFERELHRLRGYAFKRLLIVGTRKAIQAHQYRSNVNPRAILASLSAFEVRYDVPVVFEPTPDEAARRVESWVWWAAREYIENVNRLVRSTTKERGSHGRKATTRKA